MKISIDEITILILAGGAGRRVGGNDKGLLNYGKESLISQQVGWAERQSNKLIISANRNKSKYQKYNYPVVEDQGGGFRGPLYGVLAALKRCQTKWLFVQPIDLLCLPENTLQLMLDKLSANTSSAYLVSNTREHYLSMLIERGYYSLLEKYLLDGHSKVSSFHRLANSQKLNLGFSEEKFRNLNRFEDYQVLP